MSKNMDLVKTAIEKISLGLQAIETSDDWIRYLTFCSSFYNYSYNNIILIMMQRPNATFVAGYEAWQKMNRYVKQGEKGIGILCPCIRKVEAFKEPNDKNVYHDAEAEKEVKKVIEASRLGTFLTLARRMVTILCCQYWLQDYKVVQSRNRLYMKHF